MISAKKLLRIYFLHLKLVFFIFDYLEVIKVCQSTTEFHFNDLDDQLENIKEIVKEGIDWRKNHVIRDSTHQFLNLTSSEQQVT